MTRIIRSVTIQLGGLTATAHGGRWYSKHDLTRRVLEAEAPIGYQPGEGYRYDPSPERTAAQRAVELGFGAIVDIDEFDEVADPDDSIVY